MFSKNPLQQFISQIRLQLLFMVLVDNLIIFGDWWICEHVFKLQDWQMATALLIGAILALTIVPWLSTRFITQPTQLIWQAILHIAPNTTATVPPPNLKQVRLGRELVTNLVGHIYQLASVVQNVENLEKRQVTDLHHDFIANNLPLPFVVLDKNETIIFANKVMLDYLKHGEEEVVGQSIYAVLEMSFVSENTFDKWLANAKANKGVSRKNWERVRLYLPNQKATRYFDLSAYYNQDNPEGFETLLVLFDHTKQYSQDDQSMSFVALAVHELRTPLTLLRGYIEVFQEELANTVTPELKDFMRKMQVAAQQLTAFTNNILNVSRYENDQLILNLHEENWPDILQSAVADMRLRAEVQGVELVTRIASNLPTVGADRVSIYEVISNLIDNAIKYSGQSKEIIINTYPTNDGFVETTIQDFGVGVPESAIPNLFDKFYRDYHNRRQVGGTGMGLYLSKAIVNAHGGNIWVRSKEGEGSTFGFTLLPYARLAEEQKNGDNKDITRSAHGWIKNHSLYRR